METNRWWKLALWASIVATACGFLHAQQTEVVPASRLDAHRQKSLSNRFLAQRSFRAGDARTQSPAELLQKARAQHAALQAAAEASGTSPLNTPWTAVGPSAIQTDTYGSITGRVTSIAVDPADSSGNTVYVGSTGGGVWKSTNAAGQAGSVTFVPLTDTLPASSGCSTPTLASLSIGALSVQPGNTGVILAGTGDPNDALDSYYGTGILRSTDRGNTWCLIANSIDGFYGAVRNFSFRGLGFAGFAWSTANPQLVVAAVAASAEGNAVNAAGNSSFAGLYYSTDAGQTWLLATIEDSPSAIVQSSQSAVAGYTGNPSTSVTWNPVRKRFYAAVQYHGYYESLDGITWTRLANQPGVNSAKCPTNPNAPASSACPIKRGTITAQPVTGDLFAITVDADNNDQGLWQDLCSANANGCASATVTFSSQIADTPIRAGDGSHLQQGDYDLSLAAVPSQQDTLLFVGTRDIFRCSLANSCAWRNTTNVDNCAAAKVAPSQHAFDATFGASGLIYFGNDGGLWRTTDDVSQQQGTCSGDDAAHFQNLNNGIGSLAEVSSFSQNPQNPGVMMAALGAFGTAAPQVGSAWVQVLDGEGEANAIDPENPQNWYATSAVPVDINLCTQGAACNKAGFGAPVIGNSQVGNDGFGLTGFAPWILDPQNTANMIVGTCRLWRGPAASGAWSSSNAISMFLDTLQGSTTYCNGNAQIRSLAASGSAADSSGTSEKIYAGMAGRSDGGATIAGHLFEASVSDAAGTMPSWSDLYDSPVTNSPLAGFNLGGFDISSIYVDPHDSTGSTIYVTLQGFITSSANGSLIYRSIDGGATWSSVQSNLPNAPANSVVVDPNDANTVYIALDTGVYVTRNVNLCTDTTQNCWSSYGTSLPGAPVTELLAYNYGSNSLLRAATYGRGIWSIPLLTSDVVLTSAAAAPAALTFADQAMNSISNAQTVTIINTGTLTLTISSITASQNFFQQNNCTQPIAPGGTCSVQVSFAPTATGPLQGVLTVFGNVPTGQLTVSLSGNGLPAGNIVLLPTILNFGNSIIDTPTAPQNITISNTGGVSVSLQAPTVTGDFQISANTCGASLAPNSGCTVSLIFNPTTAGGRVGIFSINAGQGTQIAQLSGTGQAPATAVLSGASLTFSPQTAGTKSGPQQITITNNGDVSLTNISIAVTGDFTAQNNCGAFLVGHASCAISVVFVPTRVGPESGVLTVNTQLGAQTVTLSGTGLAPPGITALPTTVNFGGEAVNFASTPQRVVLTNNSDSDLNGLTLSVSGGDYALSGTSCPVGQTLKEQSSCYADVVFTPAQTGQRTGSLTIGAANLALPLILTLSGTGEDFQLVVAGSPSAVIVTGQTATYTVQVMPVNGSSGTLTMGCSGAPVNAVCKVNPVTLPVTGGVGAYATVTVATGVTSTSAALPLPFNPWQGIGAGVAVLFPGIFIGIKKYRWKGRTWTAFLSIVLTAALLLIPTACGVHASGGGDATPPSSPQGPATPSGVYTLNITAAIPGLQRSVPVTLTVQ